MKTNIYLILILLMISSCKKNQEHQPIEANGDSKDILLQERDSKTPFILMKKKTGDKVSTNSIPDQVLDLRYYLGRSYTLNTNLDGNPESVKFKIIDIERFLTDNPGYYLPKDIGTSEAISFSYSSFDRYENKSNYTKKISGGFNLNLGLFSIGAKKSMDEVFSSIKVNENKRIFGELSVKVKGVAYSFLNTSNVKNQIATKYLDKNFLDEIYNTPTGEFLEAYGSFVLTDFLTGGKTNALYNGLYLKETADATKETDMDNSINASYGFKTGKDAEGKITGDFGFGKKSTGSTSISKEITDLTMSVRTVGGSKTFGSFTVPKKIEDIDINLSSWVSSLNDRATHNIIGINDKGLTPISDYILEENFKQSIQNHHSGFVDLRKFQEPRIEVRKVRVTNQLATVTMFLITRFGDQIILKMTTPNVDGFISLGDNAKFLEIANRFKDNKGEFYKLKITANPNDFYLTYGKVNVNFATIKEVEMKKFIDTNSGITYLLQAGDNQKLAYAIHDDYVLDTYGIRAWVNTLPVENINPRTLTDYTIVGL